MEGPKEMDRYEYEEEEEEVEEEEEEEYEYAEADLDAVAIDESGEGDDCDEGDEGDEGDAGDAEEEEEEDYEDPKQDLGEETDEETKRATPLLSCSPDDTPKKVFEKFSTLLPGARQSHNPSAMIQRTVEEMLNTRGFEFVRSVDPSKTKTKADVVLSAKRSDSTLLALIYFKEKIGKEFAKNIKTFYMACKADKLVVVALITHAAFVLLNTEIGSVNIFTPESLLQNYTKHCLVPKHEKMSKADAELFLERKKLKSAPHHLPKISINDPIVRFHDWKRGDLIRITRNIGGAIEPNIIVRIVQ